MKINSPLMELVVEGLIERVPYFIFWKDVNSVYVGCNEQFAQLSYGKAPKEIVGKTDFDLRWGPGEAERYVQGDIAAMAGKPMINHEEVLVRSDNSKTFMLVSKTPLIEESGKCLGVLGISVDITELKNIENALQQAKETAEEARRAVTILAGSIGHDLRSPLVALTVYISLLESARKDNLSEKEQLLFDSLHQVIANINESINESLKAIQHVVHGNDDKAYLIDCNIGICTRRAIDSYPFTPEEHGKVHLEIKDNFTFLGNPVYFYRIIFNLLKNALYQIQQRGKGAITILAEVDQNIPLLRFKDTAGGVHAGTIADLFSGFNTTKTEGTGIGLAFCQLAMRAMGGDISCHIVDGDCIEFVLRFSEANITN